LIVVVIAVVVAVGFAFTLIGMAGELIAILALVALGFRCVAKVVRHAR
jgi:hypothetical protein